ncbi:MAG TPA: hypothetical protein VKV80_07675 [Streptosporangiaceae bacterium]|nr:hypothetical protein [Streptosporangiaceae bacterium]
MAGGELKAVFRALAGDAGQAGRDIGEAMARFTEATAGNEDEAVARTLAADAETARAAAAIGRQAEGAQVPGEGASPASAGTRGEAAAAMAPTNPATGTARAAGTGAPALGDSGTASSEGSVRAAVSRLDAGRNAGVSVAHSTEQLDSLFGELSHGGTPVESSYPGKLVKLTDGTTVGLRGTSASGGPTIDIRYPDGERMKVHVDPWPPTP